MWIGLPRAVTKNTLRKQMNVPTSILAFSFAAALATLTPGLDTALVLRTAAIDGKRHAMMAALGIGTGVLWWGTATALGLAELLNASALDRKSVV